VQGEKRSQQNIYSAHGSGLFCNILLIAVLKYERENCVLGEGLENHLMILVWLGIILFKEVTELAQLNWFGHVVKLGDEKYSKMAWDTRTQGKTYTGRSWQTWEEGMQKILRERWIEQNKSPSSRLQKYWWKEELNRVRVIAQDCERWKAHCKPSTPTSRRD